MKCVIELFLKRIAVSPKKHFASYISFGIIKISQCEYVRSLVSLFSPMTMAGSKNHGNGDLVGTYLKRLVYGL